MTGRQISVLLFCISLSLFAAGGCTNNDGTPAPAPTDADALKAAVTQSDSIAEFSSSDEVTIDDNGVQEPDFDVLTGSAFPRISSARTVADTVYPVRWGRRIFWNNIVRDYQVTILSDTFATVLVTKIIPGEFLVGWGTRSGEIVTIEDTVRKAFVDTVRRNVMFKRIAKTDNPGLNWTPIAVSMVRGVSGGSNGFSIYSMEITDILRGDDTMVYIPLGSWYLLGLPGVAVPVYPIGDSIQVRLTIQSDNPSPELVYLRHGISGTFAERRRVRMNLDRTLAGLRYYSKGFRTNIPRGILAARCNIIADVLSNRSVNSMTAPFANEFWGAPYIVIR
jgi:hypothetical protein